MMRIDAHHHLWQLSRGDYDWLTPAAGVLYQDFSTADLEPLLKPAGIDASILVQAAPTEAETGFLLHTATVTPWIRGVIGWTDLSAKDAGHIIDQFAWHEYLVGMRPMLQDLSDPDWILRPAVEPALRAMAETGLVFDALVRTPQRHVVPELARRHPDLKIVIDHAGKPAIAEGVDDTWRGFIEAAAAHPNIAIKLSGLLTEAPAGARADDLLPFVQILLDTFGPERIVWGSDWPVLLLNGSYDRWSAMTDALLSHISARDIAAIRGGNAARIYGI